MAVPKLKDFTIQLKIVTIADVEIKATDMTAAMEIAKTLKDTDAVEYLHGCNDSRTTVVGIFGGEEWDT